MFYRGGVGQWAWIVHRVTGVGILLFLAIHILDTALVLLGPETYNHVLSIYQHPLFRPMEVLLYGCVLYHALNGVRIILVDFWSQGSRYHKQMFYAALAVFTVLFIWGSYFMVKPLFS